MVRTCQPRQGVGASDPAPPTMRRLRQLLLRRAAGKPRGQPQAWNEIDKSTRPGASESLRSGRLENYRNARSDPS